MEIWHPCPFYLTCDPLAADLVPGCVEEEEAVEAGEEAGRQRRQSVVVQVQVLQAPRGPACSGLWA